MGTYSYGGTNNNVSAEKNRIYQYWGSNIVLDELSIPLKENTDTKNVSDVFSIEVPVIRINDKILTTLEILSVYIDCSGFLPRIELKAVFMYERFMLLNQIKDGDIISIAIRSQNDNLKIIRNDYIITNAIVSERYNSKGDENITPYMITFIGDLFVPKLDLCNLDLSYLGTSYETLKNVAKSLDLGFASNEDSTNDRQVWLNYNTTPKQFIQDIITKTWKDDKSFFDVWIDLYYNLNFINVNAQLLSSEEELDYGVLMSSVNTNFLYGGSTDKKDATIFPKFLSNHDILEGSSSYIFGWHTENKSSYITSLIGSTLNCNMFEHNDKVYSSESNIYWSLPIEPAYDTTKLNSHIILRGRCTYNEEINKGELARANYKSTDIFKKTKWMGVQYTCTNTNEDTSKWDGNQHKNYNRAIIHNNMNLYELDKLNTFISVNGVNSNMLRGDKIPILLTNKSLESPDESKGETTYSNVDRFHSGWYYIKGFNISWLASDDDQISRFKQTYILTRREWPTPEDVEPIKSK